MIGSYWENIHTFHAAEIVAEPIVGVFELRYLDKRWRENLETGEFYSVRVENQRWSAHDLHRHWQHLGNEPIDEEE
ncbi:MAG: hypothetical protein CMI60_09065 [Parvibaculum sp.]|nr:hypothetical protein [Parvibaculum sp.]